MNCFRILIFFFFSFYVYSQDSISTTFSLQEIKALEKKEKLKEASQLLLKKIKNYKNTDKNKVASVYEKYYDYYFLLTSNKDKKHDYSYQLVQLRGSAKETDTLSLIKAYYYYATYQNNIADDANKSLVYIEKAIKLWEKKFKKPTDLYARLITLKASVLHNLLLEGESFVMYEQAIKIYETIENPDLFYLTALYNNLGTNYIRYGFYKKASFYLQKARNYIEKNQTIILKSEKQENNAYATLLHNFAQFARLYKDTENEKELFKIKEAAEVYIKNKNSSKRAAYNLSAIYNYIGLYFLYEKEDYQQALNYFKKASITIPEDFLITYHHYYRMNQAKALIGLNKNEEADKILKILVKKNNIPKSLKGFMYVANTHIEALKNNRKSSIDNANKGVFCFSKNKQNINLLSNSIVLEYLPSKRLNDTKQLVKMAQILEKTSKNKDSLQIAANHIYKIALKQFKNCYTKNFYSDKLEKMYNQITLGILKTNKLRYGNYDEDLSVLKNNIDYKSKFLWHHFLLNNSNDILKIPDSLISLEQQLRKKLSTFKLEKEKKQTQDYDNLIIEIEEKITKLTEEISDKYASFNYFDKNNFNLSSFVNNLKPDEVFVKYEKIDSLLFVFFIGKNKVETLNLGNYKIIEEGVQKYINKYLQKINKPNTKLEEKIFNDLALNKILPYNNITIVPDKILYFLPFDVLKHNNHYLIESKNIKYANSLPLLLYQPQITKRKTSKLTFFTPSYKNGSLSELKGAVKETEKINEIIPGTIYLGTEATKQNFIKNSKNFGVIHLAMHTFINEQNPDLSTLVFSDCDKENMLNINELYGLNFQSDLAVLSACKTGIGGFKTGEGLVSLSRAFTYAGVPATVSSLWNAPDQSTQEIMVAFYKNLKEGQNKSTALHNAKLNYLHNTKNTYLKAPFYWAGFVMYGNDQAITFNDTLNYLWAFLIALGVIVIIYFLRKKKT